MIITPFLSELTASPSDWMDVHTWFIHHRSPSTHPFQGITHHESFLLPPHSIISHNHPHPAKFILRQIFFLREDASFLDFWTSARVENLSHVFIVEIKRTIRDMLWACGIKVGRWMVVSEWECKSGVMTITFLITCHHGGKSIISVKLFLLFVFNHKETKFADILFLF